MRKFKRWGAFALAAALAAGTMSGCTRLEEKTEQDTVAATFDGEDIMLDYVMYQMRSAQYSYEQMFSAWYGTTDFWGQDYGDGRTIEEYVIESIMASIRQTKVLCDYAEKNDIALNDEQKQKVDDAVAKAMEADAEYLELVGATEEILRTLFTENAIANLAYLDLVADVDTTVGDDEFIRKDMDYVKLTPTDLEEESAEEPAGESSSDDSTEDESEDGSQESGEAEEVSSEEQTETEETDTEESSDAAETETETDTAAEESSDAAKTDAETEDTTAEESSDAAKTDTETEEEATEASADETDPEALLTEGEKEQKKAISKAAEEIQKKLDDGEAAADFISEYNEDTTYFTAIQSTSTVGEDSTFVYTADAFALATGESTIYTDESTGAVYILRCTNDNDTEARQNAIDSEIESRKAELFAEKYAQIQEDSPKFTVDQDVMAKITFSTALYVPETTEAESTEEEGTEESGAEEDETGTDASSGESSSEETEEESVTAAEEEKTAEAESTDAEETESTAEESETEK